jgi:hypothetical protein
VASGPVQPHLPVRRIPKYCSPDLASDTACLLTQIQSDRIGESDTVEIDFPAEEADDSSRCVEEIARSMNSAWCAHSRQASEASS